MKFQVYSDKAVFEKILLDEANYSNWNNILISYSEVLLNMSDEEYESEIVDTENSIIFQYIQQTSGREPIPRKKFFEDFESDNSIVCQNVFAAFFMNKKDDEIRKLIDAYGILFMNEKIDDKALVGTYVKNFAKKEVYQGESKKGWEVIFGQKNFIFNSVVITDPHIFLNEQNSINIGVPNLINFMDAILPKTLLVPMHILIICSETNKEGQKRNAAGFTNEKATRIYNSICVGFKKLRNYDFHVELIFTTDTIHDRYVFTNYNFFKAGSGFKIFSPDDDKTVLQNNNIEMNYIFQRHKNEEGDSTFYTATKELQNAKSELIATLRTLKVLNRNIEYKKSFGLNNSYQIQNRLLNYFP